MVPKTVLHTKVIGDIVDSKMKNTQMSTICNISHVHDVQDGFVSWQSGIFVDKKQEEFIMHRTLVKVMRITKKFVNHWFNLMAQDV